MQIKQWGIHFCPLDFEDRRITGQPMPWRFHFNTPWFHYAFALRRKDRFVRIKDYYSGKPKDEWEYISEWTMFKRNTKER